MPTPTPPPPPAPLIQAFLFDERLADVRRGRKREREGEREREKRAASARHVRGQGGTRRGPSPGARLLRPGTPAPCADAASVAEHGTHSHCRTHSRLSPSLPFHSARRRRHRPPPRGLPHPGRHPRGRPAQRPRPRRRRRRRRPGGRPGRLWQLVQAGEVATWWEGGGRDSKEKKHARGLAWIERKKKNLTSFPFSLVLLSGLDLAGRPVRPVPVGPVHAVARPVVAAGA